MNKTLIAITLAALNGAAFADEVSNEELLKLLEAQSKRIEALERKLAQTEQKVEVTAEAVENKLEVAQQSNSAVVSTSSAWSSKTSIGGYGEHHLNINDGKQDKVDAHRYVLFFNHEFSDKLSFHSELELEHSLAGDGKPGEVELEQAYISYQFADNHSADIGLFLLPIGILNETHEPDTFYGVERNNIEKNIIPTTWWETGVAVKGELAPGWSYTAAIHSGLKTDDAGKVRNGRQKSAEAIADDYAFTGRVKYTGVPGLEVAASLQYQQNITQGLGMGDNAATLIEAHAKYNTGPFSLTALYAGWDIDGENFAASGRDEQSGWYVEGSYKFTEQLGFFVRQGEWDNNAGNSVATEVKQFDFGFNYWLHKQVVLKADISNQSGAEDSDALNLGIGWSY